MSRRSRRSPREILEDAQAHFDVVAQYATEDVEDQLTVDAICMRLPADIETLSTLDYTAREAFFGKAWHQMWGMRNRIVTATYSSIQPSCTALSSATCRSSSARSTTPSTNSPKRPLSPCPRTVLPPRVAPQATDRRLSIAATTSVPFCCDWMPLSQSLTEWPSALEPTERRPACLQRAA